MVRFAVVTSLFGLSKGFLEVSFIQLKVLALCRVIT